MYNNPEATVFHQLGNNIDRAALTEDDVDDLIDGLRTEAMRALEGPSPILSIGEQPDWKELLHRDRMQMHARPRTWRARTNV